MRRIGLTLALFLAAWLMVAPSAPGSIAGTSATSQASRGPLQVEVSGQMSPLRLPRRGTAPVAAQMGGEIRMAGGSLPPKLKVLRIEINRQGRIDPRGLPVCRVSQIQPGTSEQALEACRPSLVGRGSFSAQIALEGQPPYATRGELLVFNSRQGRRPVLLGHIFTSRPFFNSFVIAFQVRRINRGPFGTELVARIPRSLESWGHITGINMRLARIFRFRGRPKSYLSAGCPAPRGFRRVLFPFTRSSFLFEGGTKLQSVLRGRCVPR